MFMTFVALVLFASVPLTGGRLRRLTDIRIQRSRLLPIALGMQILMTVLPSGTPRWVLIALHFASYAVIAVVLWANRHWPGLKVLGAGTLMNGAVIALNGGTLPARAQALAEAGIKEQPGAFVNSGHVAHPIAGWFGDILATPSWLPFRNVISIGDMLILLGLAILLHCQGETVVARVLRRRPAAVARPAGYELVS